jgi:hypothetical protein
VHRVRPDEPLEPVVPVLVSDDYTSAEEEDFDLPLFAANVLTSPDRKRFFELRWC